MNPTNQQLLWNHEKLYPLFPVVFINDLWVRDVAFSQQFFFLIFLCEFRVGIWENDGERQSFQSMTLITGILVGFLTKPPLTMAEVAIICPKSTSRNPDIKGIRIKHD